MADIDWKIVNQMADEAIEKILDFIEEFGEDEYLFPTRSYFNRRLEKARAKRYWRKNLEGLSPDQIIERLLAEEKEYG